MADKLVVDALLNQNDNGNGCWGPYWSDTQKGVIVFIKSGVIQANLSFSRTINGGEDWVETQIVVGNTRHIAAWYDKETPGNTGTLVHIAWLDVTSDECTYVTVDVADATVGTIRTVASSLSVQGDLSSNRVAVSRAVNGDVMVAFGILNDVTETHTSNDLFDTNNETVADVFDTGDAAKTDWVLLFPADVDAGDFAAMYWDRSVNQITVKIFDSSAGGGSPPVGTWSETLISGSMTDDFNHMNMDGSVRHSDKVILFAAHSNDDQNQDDLLTWAITVDTIPVAPADIVGKANVFTAQGESAQVSVHINQQPSLAHVRIAYLKGGQWQSEVDVVFHLSTDGMDTWGSEEEYSESLDDHRLVHAGRTVGDDGGRYQPAFYDDDDLELFVNLVNDIEIAAVGGPSTEFAATESGPEAMVPTESPVEVVEYGDVG